MANSLKISAAKVTNELNFDIFSTLCVQFVVDTRDVQKRCSYFNFVKISKILYVEE